MTSRSNIDWIHDLRAEGETHSLALDDLRSLIMKQLYPIFAAKLPPDSPALSRVMQATLQSTQTFVLNHMDTYEGEIAFTTWALKIAIRQGFFHLRQMRFQSNWYSLIPPKTPLSFRVILAFRPALKRFHAIMREELDENQRMAIQAMVMFQVPKEEVAQHLGMALHDYFKMIHDARLRMKHRLQADGWFRSPDIIDD